ncbi:MAG: geranylgeranylglycerol-phosphate geranylgeranyltransferase [Candidatus Heimdallarchaeota archaeon]
MSSDRFSKKEIILSYITILRLVNGLVAGVAAAFGIVLSLPSGVEINYLNLILVVIATIFVSSQAMIFNDIADREEDAINAPHRPIPSGKISVKTAKIYGIIFVVLSLLTALSIDLINTELYGLSVVTLIIFGGSLNLYNFKLKRMGFWGNLTIGFNVVALFAYGSIHTYILHPAAGIAWVPISVGICAGSGNVGREVIKGLPDIEGDREASVRTIAVKFGPKVTAVIGSLFLWGLIAGALISSILPMYVVTTTPLYLTSQIIVYLIAAVATFLAIAILFNQKPKWAYITKEILLFVFLAFLLVFIIDKIVRLALGG